MPRLRQCRAVLRSLLYLFLRRILDFCHSKERSATDAELEIAILRHQLAVLRRQVRRPVYRASDRAFLADREQTPSARSVAFVPPAPGDSLSLAPRARGQEMDQAASTTRSA